MKRILAMALALILLVSLLGCDASGEKSGNADGASSSATTSSTAGAGGTTDSSSTQAPPVIGDGEQEFTVQIVCKDPVFEQGIEPITVTWTDGVTYVESQTDANGMATAGALDGNFIVTLKNLPIGYTYNPNPYNAKHKTYGHLATNDDSEITIEIFRLGDTTGAGNDLYKRKVLEKTNVYRATLLSSDQKIYFEFAPKKSGTYTIESWLPVTDDKINPKVDVYSSNAAAPMYQYTLDLGGAEGASYTKNFKYEVEIADEMISSGGQVVFIFAIYTTARNDKYYPVNVDFAVQYNGEFELQHIKSDFVIPQETDIIRPTLSQYYEDIEGKEWHSPAITIGGKKVLITAQGNKVYYKYNEATRFYHKYDAEKYASDPYGYGAGYGPVLYADITSSTRTSVLDTAFTLIEYKGNKALTVSNGTENYKLFIEGYSDAITNCPEEYKYVTAYAHIVNKDGAAPVTRELKEFLQKYSINQLMFMDGDGWAETGKTYGGESYESTENDQWLFACGYYE